MDAQARFALQSIEGYAGELRQLGSLLRLQVPQVWTWDLVRAHYPALSDDEIKRRLRAAGWAGGSAGQRLAIHVDLIRRVDQELARELVPAHPSLRGPGHLITASKES